MKIKELIKQLEMEDPESDVKFFDDEKNMVSINFVESVPNLNSYCSNTVVLS